MASHVVYLDTRRTGASVVPVVIVQPANYSSLASPPPPPPPPRLCAGTVLLSPCLTCVLFYFPHVLFCFVLLSPCLTCVLFYFPHVLLVCCFTFPVSYLGVVLLSPCFTCVLFQMSAFPGHSASFTPVLSTIKWRRT